MFLNWSVLVFTCFLFHSNNFGTSCVPCDSVHRWGCKYSHCWLSRTRLLPPECDFPVDRWQWEQSDFCTISSISKKQQIYRSQCDRSVKMWLVFKEVFQLFCDSPWRLQKCETAKTYVIFNLSVSFVLWAFSFYFYFQMFSTNFYLSCLPLSVWYYTPFYIKFSIETDVFNSTLS